VDARGFFFLFKYYLAGHITHRNFFNTDDNDNNFLSETIILYLEIMKTPRQMIEIEIEGFSCIFKNCSWRGGSANFIRVPNFTNFIPPPHRHHKYLSKYLIGTHINILCSGAPHFNVLGKLVGPPLTPWKIPKYATEPLYFYQTIVVPIITQVIWIIRVTTKISKITNRHSNTHFNIRLCCTHKTEN